MNMIIAIIIIININYYRDHQNIHKLSNCSFLKQSMFFYISPY